MNYGYIYLTTNLINNKKYIGKKKNPIFDNSYLGSGILISKAVKKYGCENFKVEVLAWCNSLEELNLSEIKYIEKYNAVKSHNFYNIANGGDGGNIIGNLSPQKKKEFLNKMSKVTSGKNNPMYGRNRRLEGNTTKGYKIWTDDRPNPNKGKKLSDEQKKNIGDRNRGENNGRYNKKWDDSYKKIFKESKLGQKNPMYGMTGALNPSSKKVMCINTGEIFDCISMANKKYKTSKVGEVCRGKRKHAGKDLKTGEKLKWKYL